MILVVVSDAWSIRIAIAVLFSLSFFLDLLWFVYPAFCSVSMCVTEVLATETNSVTPSGSLCAKASWRQAVVIFNQHSSHRVTCMLHCKMFQWQASEATSAIRLWKDPKLWVSWKLNSAQEWWHTVKRRQKYLLLLISWFCPSGLLYIIVILGAAMHKFDLWLCCCMAGWLRWQAVSVIVDRSSPTKAIDCVTAWYLRDGHLE